MLPRHLSWLMSPVWVSHVLNINESRPTNLWVTPRIRMRAVCNATQLQASRLIHVPHMSESQPPYTYVISHIFVPTRMSHGHMRMSAICNVTESSFTSPALTSHATRINDHVPQICESRYTTAKSRMQWTVNVRLTHQSVNKNILDLQIVVLHQNWCFSTHVCTKICTYVYIYTHTHMYI